MFYNIKKVVLFLKFVTSLLLVRNYGSIKIYKLIDRVSVGSPLGLVLANIIMTDLESMTIKDSSLIWSLLGQLGPGFF